MNANSGRPPGRKNHETKQATGELTRCPDCGSTNREPYWFRVETPYSGCRCDHCKSFGMPDGTCPCGGTYSVPVTHIVRRKTRCRDCGQVRFDIIYENRAAPNRGRKGTTK